MTLDRGTLAKIDRRILFELDHTEGVQLVKVPVSDAVWSTWRRYCDAIGVTMGQGTRRWFITNSAQSWGSASTTGRCLPVSGNVALMRGGGAQDPGGAAEGG